MFDHVTIRASNGEVSKQFYESMVAFTAEDDWFVDEFHRAAVEAGYRDNGAPGERD